MSTQEVINEVPDSPKAEAVAALDSVVEEAVKLFDVLKKAVKTTAQDVTSLMVVHVDKETRQHMDLLVESGAAKSRSEAATVLMHEGAQAKQALFKKIARTNDQITALKTQMQSLIASNS